MTGIGKNSPVGQYFQIILKFLQGLFDIWHNI